MASYFENKTALAIQNKPDRNLLFNYNYKYLFKMLRITGNKKSFDSSSAFARAKFRKIFCQIKWTIRCQKICITQKVFICEKGDNYFVRKQIYN